MRTGRYRIALLCLLAFAFMVSTAQASTSREAALQEVEHIHNLNFTGGEATLEWCRRKNTRLLLCSGHITGTPKPGTSFPAEPLSCNLGVYAYQRRDGEQHTDVTSRITCTPQS